MILQLHICSWLLAGPLHFHSIAYRSRKKHTSTHCDLCNILPPSFIWQDQNEIQGCNSSKSWHWKNKRVISELSCTQNPLSTCEFSSKQLENKSCFMN